MQELCWAAAEHRFTDPAKSESMLRDALKQYPGNEVILNNLLYVMQVPDRYDGLDYTQGRRAIWLEEDVWPRLKE